MVRYVLALVLLAMGAQPVAAAPATSAEKDVLAAMETWRHAMLKKDAAAFDKVFHPELTYGHSIGLIETKRQAIDHVMKSTTVYRAVDFAETKVSVRGDMAVVTGKVHYEKHPKNQPVLHQHLSVLSIWLKTAGGWQMIARQSTEPKPAQPVAQSK
jgi:ketosteroid isomerase-like protein